MLKSDYKEFLVNRDYSGDFLVSYTRPGVSHWFVKEIKQKSDISQFAHPVPKIYEQKRLVGPFLTVSFPILAMLASVSLTLSFSRFAELELSHPFMVYSIVGAVLSSVALFIGFVKGVSTRRGYYPILKNKGKITLDQRFKHIISIRADISTPTVIDGLYSVPSSWMVGYRVLRTYKHRGGPKYSYGLALVLKNQTLITLSPRKTILQGNYDKLYEAMQSSSTALGFNPERKAKINKPEDWYVQGVPEHIPLDQVYDFYSKIDSTIPKITYKGSYIESFLGLEDSTGCNECKKTFALGELIIEPEQSITEDFPHEFICRGCLSKRIQEKVSKYNNIDHQFRKYVNWTAIRKSIQEARLEIKSTGVSIIFVVFIGIIMLFFLLWIPLMLIQMFGMIIGAFWLSELVLLVAIGWFGYLLAPKPIHKHNLRQLRRLDIKMSSRTLDYLNQEFQLDLKITPWNNNLNHAFRIFGMFMFCIWMLFIIPGIFMRFETYPPPPLPQSSNVLALMALLLAIPVFLSILGIYYGSISLITTEYELFTLNYYVPPEYLETRDPTT